MFIGRTQIGVDFELHFTIGFKARQFLGALKHEKSQFFSRRFYLGTFWEKLRFFLKLGLEPPKN